MKTRNQIRWFLLQFFHFEITSTVSVWFVIWLIKWLFCNNDWFVCDVKHKFVSNRSGGYCPKPSTYWPTGMSGISRRGSSDRLYWTPLNKLLQRFREQVKIKRKRSSVFLWYFNNLSFLFFTVLIPFFNWIFEQKKKKFYTITLRSTDSVVHLTVLNYYRSLPERAPSMCPSYRTKTRKYLNKEYTMHS